MQSLQIYCKLILPAQPCEVPSVQGLRTLVLGTKLLDADWFQDWDERYEQAKGALTQRDERLAELALEIEQGLELVGATAIEDKLQVGAQREDGEQLHCPSLPAPHRGTFFKGIEGHSPCFLLLCAWGKESPTLHEGLKHLQSAPPTIRPQTPPLDTPLPCTGGRAGGHRDAAGSRHPGVGHHGGQAGDGHQHRHLLQAHPLSRLPAHLQRLLPRGG